MLVLDSLIGITKGGRGVSPTEAEPTLHKLSSGCLLAVSPAVNVLEYRLDLLHCMTLGSNSGHFGAAAWGGSSI